MPHLDDLLRSMQPADDEFDPRAFDPDQSPPNDGGDELPELDLSDLLDRRVKGWRPQPGEKLIGQVVNIETAGEDSPFGSYPLLTILKPDGDLIRVHCFHTVLKNEIRRKNVVPGTRLGIKYDGRREGRDFGSFEAYTVVVQPRKLTSR